LWARAAEGVKRNLNASEFRATARIGPWQLTTRLYPKTVCFPFTLALRRDIDPLAFMKLSLLRPPLLAGAMVIATCSNFLLASSVDLPLPESEMPALGEMVKSALSKSPRTMAHDFALLTADYQAMINSASLYPQVGGSYQYQVRAEDQGFGDGYVAASRTFYNLNINQALWHWGSVRAAARVGELGAMIAKHDLAGVRRSLAVEVRDAYLALILQKMGVRNTRFADDLLKRTLEQQEIRFKAAEITHGEISITRLRKDESSLAVDRAVSDLAFAIDAFRRLTGVESFSEAEIPDAIAPPIEEPAQAAPFEHKGYLKSESLLINELQIEQAMLNYKIDRKLLWPKLNAIAGVAQDDNLYSTTQGTITTSTTFVGLHLQWSIFDGFSAKGRRLQSRTRLRQLQETRSDLIETLGNSANQQAAQVGFAWRAFKHARHRRQWAEAGVANEKDNLSRGLSSEEQIATAQAALSHAELVANDALAKFYSACARYASTMQADPLIDGKFEN
jgi:outer membrane protein TolC